MLSKLVIDADAYQSIINCAGIGGVGNMKLICGTVLAE
jgi:hypothetical protein